LVTAATRNIPHVDHDMFNGVILCRTELDTMLSELQGQPVSASLAVLDPLVFQGEWHEPDASSAIFDQTGLSSYARIVSALLSHVSRHRDLARTNVWTVRHLYALRIYAQDVLDVPFGTSPVFGAHTSRAFLEDLVRQTDQITVYLLAEDHEPGWLAQLALRLGQNKSAAWATDATVAGIESLLKGLTSPGKDSAAIRDSRILHLVLQHLLAGANKQDAEQFLVFARNIEKTGRLY
jgi:E3 ubiquitin-protein ligase listerin